MKNIIFVLLSLVILSCQKENIVKEDITIESQARIWRGDTYKNSTMLDSARFEFYNLGELVPFNIAYTLLDGKVRVTLKQDQEYLCKVYTATYKDGFKTYHYATSSYFHSTKGNKGLKPNNFQITMNYPTDGNGSTFNTYIDPTK